MPKVESGYLDARRSAILDAAETVAKSKPLHHVTMKDIIRQCGVSQGAIYHYFQDLDAIWLGLVLRFNEIDNHIGGIEAMILQDEKPSIVLPQVIDRLMQNLLVTVPRFGKLLVEFNAMVTANPGSYSKMLEELSSVSSLEKLENLFLGYCEKQLAAGSLSPVLPLEDAALHTFSAYIGIRYMAASLQLDETHYPQGLEGFLNVQAAAWKKSMLFLLGVHA